VVGEDAFAFRGLLDFHYPIGEKGKIVDFDALEDILSYTANYSLRCNLKEKSILLCDTYNSDKGSREKATELLFETFQADSAYFAMSSILAMYATGRTSGMILECGAGQTLVIPVYEGYHLAHCVSEHCYAGHDMATLLAKLMSEHERNRKTGLDLNSAYGVHLLESVIIEKAMNFAEIVEAAADAVTGIQESLGASKKSTVSPSTYSLPDGREVFIDEAMIKKCGDMYFSPENIGITPQEQDLSSVQSIVRCMETGLQKLDVDARNVGAECILTGGVAGCKGFYERFVTEFEPIFPKYVRSRRDFAKSCISWRKCGVKHPCHMAWKGGSIMASLQTFGSMWIKKSDYEEAGPGIVNRKCY
jgi:actin